jgi:cytochrome c-type biogenesis protein
VLVAPGEAAYALQKARNPASLLVPASSSIADMTFVLRFSISSNQLFWGAKRRRRGKPAATGIGFLTGTMQNLSYWLLQTFPGLANLG